MLTLKHRVMFRVYLFWAFRFLRQRLTVELASVLVLFGTLAFTTSVPSIVSNMLEAQNPFRYFLYAFSHGDYLIQFLVILTSLAGIYVARHFAPRKIFNFRLVRFA